MAQAKHHPGVPIGFQQVVKQLQNRVTELERQLRKMQEREAVRAKPAPTPKRGRPKKEVEA